MKLGIISLGGKSSIALEKEAQNHFEEVLSLDIRDFTVELTNEKTRILYKETELDNDFDCLILRGSFRYSILQRALTKAYQKKAFIPNSWQSYSLAHDKFKTLLELQKDGISIPKTHYASTSERAKELLKKVNFPIIMKLQEGTHGKGVMVAESEKSAKTILDILDAFNKPYIIQEFVNTKEMSDIRAVVVGNNVVCAYKRVAAEGDIRSNVHSGGIRKRHQLNKAEERLALRSAKSIGAKICGVDIFDSANPSVIEVNLSPAIGSLKEVSDENVPKVICEYLKRETEKFIEKKEKLLKKKMEKKKKKIK